MSTGQNELLQIVKQIGNDSSKETNVDNTTYENNAKNNDDANSKNNVTSQNTSSQQQAVQYTETQIATFSTKIYSKDSARQNNIRITCNTLNGSTVKNGATFSFCSTVGKATSAKGYQKADVYDKNGNKKKGLRWR